MPYYLKGNLLCEHREVKFSRFFNYLSCKVALLAGYCYSCRVFRNLKGGIYNTAVVPLSLGGQNKQTVGELEEGGGVDFRFFLALNESSGLANLQKPFRDEPHRAPFRVRCHG